MEKKNKKVENVEEIDVDELIAEGLEKHRQLKELAAK